MARILIVDDDKDNTTMFRHMLMRDSHDVAVAHHTDEIHPALVQTMPDLLLLDILLPGGMNGLEIVPYIREDATFDGLCIVAMTAAPNLFNEESALAAGCDAFFAKPVPLAKLRDFIRAMGILS